jgi:hypothetical protein
MYRNASQCLKGPVSRSRPWWQDEAGETGTAPAGCSLAEPEDEAEEGAIRWEVVAQARRAVAAGAYDSPEVLLRAAEQMLRRLGLD